MFRSCIRLLIIVAAGMLPVIVSADIIDGEDLVDPTRPLLVNQVAIGSTAGESGSLDVFRNAAPSSFEVTFVRAGNSAPMAIVNQQRVTLGDIIGGAEVVAIDRDGVTLAVEGFERRISIFSSGVKGPVRQ